MSIAVLTQVYDEVRRLAIAGSVVAGGDFRLKKLVPPLEQAGQKAPVFAKVAGGVNKVVESNEAQSAEALLELSSLVNAILYTQGETGAAGELLDIATVDLGQQQTQASARVLKPLLEALSTTGSGRIEIIRDAHERGAFKDLRLIKPALAALDDSYSEISELVAEKILPIYGPAILPELRGTFDPQGKGGHVRRLQLMHRLDRVGTRPLVKDALENGSKEVKVVAIACLGDEAEDLSFLLEQARAKAKEVRAAAFHALAKSSAEDAVAVLKSALQSKNLEIVVRPLQTTEATQLVQAAIEETQTQSAKLLSSTEKDNKNLGLEVSRMLLLLDCFHGRQDQPSSELVRQLFAHREALSAVKGEPSGKDIVQKLVALMAEGNQAAQQELVDAHASLSEEDLPHAFVAACRALPPKDVFQRFSPYLTAKFDEKKKKRDPAYLKQQAISDLLARAWRYRFHHFNPAEDDDEDARLVQRLDPRWLDLAVAQKNLEVVQSLARPGNKECDRLLLTAFEETLKKSKDVYDCGFLLRTMARVEHPQTTDALIAAIKKYAKGSRSWGFYYVTNIIPQLPATAIKPLEELISSLSDKKMADQILEAVAELKLKFL